MLDFPEEQEAQRRPSVVGVFSRVALPRRHRLAPADVAAGGGGLVLQPAAKGGSNVLALRAKAPPEGAGANLPLGERVAEQLARSGGAMPGPPGAGSPLLPEGQGKLGVAGSKAKGKGPSSRGPRRSTAGVVVRSMPQEEV